LYSFGTGGLEKGIATVVGNASPEFEHIVVCLTESGASARLLPPGTRVIELHKPPGNSLRFLWRLARVLRSLRPDVVHTRNWSGMDAVIAARLAGIRNVVHGEHGWGVEDPEGLNPKRLRVRRFLDRWVREYTCVARAMVPWLQDTVGVRRPVTQIYNGIDTERFRPGPEGARSRDEFGIPADAFVVGVVGRLDPIKDHPTLFAAFDALRGSVPSARLLVVGDGPERGRLEALAGEGVLFAGDRRDVPELMRAMDVFVLPSRNEGISNTILEAMATGLPIVATDVGGNPELVLQGRTGTLVSLGDPILLGAALRKYRSNLVHRAREGQLARARACDVFSVGAMVLGYEEVYGRVGWGRAPGENGLFGESVL
jgi:sugar transferase (PEP-CTERM/EpsH1 system associated)